MPARVTMYCRKPADSISAEALKDELDLMDLYTLAECLDLPEGEEAAVNEMQKHLRIEDRVGSNLIVEIFWKKSGRPIQVERFANAKDELRETIDESLPPSDSPGAARVKAHLEECCDIVDFEMGIDDSMHLGATIAEVLAFYVAEQYDGLVWFYSRDWGSPDDRGETIWTTA